MTNLSPAAQAVLNAYFTHADLLNREVSQEEMIAAVIRVAADQLINVKWSVEMWELHRDFHAIATELEGVNGPA